MANYNPGNYQSAMQSGMQGGMQSAAHGAMKSGAASTAGVVSRSALNLGGVGAMVGGVAAAAQVIPQVRNNQMSAGQATREVVKEAAGAGVATAAGAAVAGAVGLGGFVSLLAMFGVATGVKYLWNSAFDGACCAQAAAPAPAEEPPAPKTTRAKKTAK